VLVGILEEVDLIEEKDGLSSKRLDPIVGNIQMMSIRAFDAITYEGIISLIPLADKLSLNLRSARSLTPPKRKYTDNQG